MIDFTKAKISKGVNKKEKRTTGGKPKADISIPIRSSTVSPKLKLEMKNFNISMYKQVYCFCDKCETETVHYLKDQRTNCMYCNSGYTFAEYSKNKPVLETTIPYIYELIYL